MKAVVANALIDNRQANFIKEMYVYTRILPNQKTVRGLPEDAFISDCGLMYFFILKPMDKEAHARHQIKGEHRAEMHKRTLDHGDHH